MAQVDTTALINLAITETPNIITGLQVLFAKQNPTAAVPTSAEVIAAFNSAFVSSLSQDDQWLGAHPAE